ncbi:hypothetical protein N657DRAFT_684380 [Parathielavia appendiculata]|uniref:RING-type domain-containing protein n=1 Tax=Parathielavia appendiculata TaxID=2587402 RepID=A0AAN6TS00_9PEZI|nr:hypothetical protein N657DRAFT_684380 [Parathielavia appendiculata]
MERNPSSSSKPTNNDRAENEETIEEDYWPNIERYFEPICQINRLQVPNLPENQVGEDGRPTNADMMEYPKILPCGHVLGDACLARWMVAAEEEGGEPICPICNRLGP